MSDPVDMKALEAAVNQPESDGSTTLLLSSRGATHGDWKQQAALAYALKDTMSMGRNWPTMLPAQREALEMIAVKMSRILSGDPLTPDHWDDIAGYARLGHPDA